MDHYLHPDRKSQPGSASRNAEPIQEAVIPILEKACDDTHDRHLHVLEVGSGEGIQLATIASCALTNKSLRNVVFQPSETDLKGCKEVNETCHGLSNVFPCQQLHLDEGMGDVFNSACDVQELPNTRAIDVILAFNVIHIVPWQSVKALFSTLDGHRYTFQSDRNVRLVFYGAFHEDGCCTSPGNKEFDRHLRAKDSRYGLRDLQRDLVPLAAEYGFAIEEKLAMPAGNLLVTFISAK